MGAQGAYLERQGKFLSTEEYMSTWSAPDGHIARDRLPGGREACGYSILGKCMCNQLPIQELADA